MVDGSRIVAPQKGSALGQSEHRQITVLMTDLVGFTSFVERMGEEAAFTLVSYVSELTTAAIHRHRGTVKNFTGDGILALFGTPTALEDGPLRACRAALEIQKRLAEASDRIEAELVCRPLLRISITTGPVVIGAVDSGESTGVTAHGDIVNLAARLQTEALPGTVVISDSMLRQVDGMVETEPAGVFYFKGKSEQQVLHRLVAIKDNATRFDLAVARGLTGYVGRDHEMAVLDDQLKHLNSVRVVDIVGDPGIGKSRLLYEFALRHRAGGVLKLRGNCSADGQETPLLPFIDVLRNWLSLSPGENEAAIFAKLEGGLRRLGCWTPQNLALLLNLLGLKTPGNALADLDGTLIGARTRDLLIRLIEEQSRQSTLVLMLEDLHWIDSASEDLLLRIIDREPAPAVVILNTRRPEYTPAWAGRAGAIELRMMPLSTSETLRIAQRRFGADHLPGPLAELIAEKAEGNALFAEEIASFLIDRGVVRVTSRGVGYDTTQIATVLPASVQLLLTARADRLLVNDRKLLQMASVIGRRFDPKLLAAVASELDDVEARLVALQELGFVQREPSSGDFAFRHVLMRDALYDTLLSSQKSEIHLKVGHAIELRAEARLSEVVETLAYHFLLSGHAGKAFRYCSLSGTKSLEIYSLEEAENYFRKALDLLMQRPDCTDDMAMASVAVGLLEVLYLKGDLIGLSEIAQAYIPRLEALGRTPQLVFALYFHCMLLSHFCDFRAAEARAKLAVSVAGGLNDIRAQAYARSALLFCSIILGRHSLEEAEHEGQRVLEICKQSGDNYILNWAYWSIAWNYVCRGLTRNARSWAVQLMEAGRQRQDNRALGMAFWTLAWIDIQAYRFSDGIANAARCQRTAATPFDRNAGTMAHATGLVLEGRVDEGLAQLLSLKKWALAHRWEYSASGVDFAVGPALAMTGRIGEGIRTLKAAIAACDRVGSLAIASWNRLALAELYLGILSTRRRPPLKVVLFNMLTIVKVRLFGAREARLLVEQIMLSYPIHPDSMTEARIELNLARLSLRQNDRALARRHLAKARAAALVQDSALMLGEIDAAIASACGVAA